MQERPTEGMPDMMPKGTVDNPPQKVPQNIPVRMVDEPYNKDEDKEKEKPDKREINRQIPPEIPDMPKKPTPDIDITDHKGGC